MSKPQCCKRVWRDHRDYPCARSGKVERDGKWYCGLHDPESRKRKDTERRAKWDLQYRQHEHKRKIERLKEEFIIEARTARAEDTLHLMWAKLDELIAAESETIQ